MTSSRRGVLHVLPVADRVEEELFARAAAGAGAAFGVGLSTMGELERRLFRAAGLAPLDRPAAELLVDGLAERAAAGSSLAAVAGEPAFAGAFLDLYDQLREGGSDGGELGRAARRLGGLAGRRAAALGEVARAYEAALGERGLVDQTGARRQLVAHLSRGPLPEGLAGGLVIEDVLDWPVLRARLLGRLAARGIPVEVRLPWLPEDSPLGPSLLHLQSALLEEAPEVVITAKRYGEGALDGLAERLLAREPLPGQAAVTLVEAADPAAERRAIVHLVRQRLDEGAAPDEICVAVPGLPAVRSQLAAAFDDAGLPWRDRRGARALEAPPCALALGIVDLVEAGLPRRELSRLLTSGYVDGHGAVEGGGLTRGAELVELLRLAGSADDLDVGHRGRLAAHLRRPGRPGDEPRRRRQRAAAARLDQLLGALALPAVATVQDHVEGLLAALETLGVFSRCRAREDRDDGRYPAIDAACARALARDQAGQRALLVAGEQLVAAARRVGAAERRLSRRRFRHLLAGLLDGATLPGRGARGGAVLFAEVSELAGRRFPHLILTRLVDGLFPASPAALPLLDGDDRQAFDEAARRGVFRHRRADDELWFALAVSSARGSLAATTCRRDDSGSEVVPSRFFQRLAAAVREPLLAAQESALAPPLRACRGAGELLLRAALAARGAAMAAGDPEAGALLAAVDEDGALGPRLRRSLKLAAGFATAPDGGRLRQPAAIAAVVAQLAAAGRELGPSVRWLTSATGLSDYAKCPFRFFARSLLHLDEVAELDEELDPREGGSLLHHVLHVTWSALAEARLLPLRGGPHSADERRVALAAVETALDRWEAEDRTGPLPFWGLRRDEATLSVLRLLEQERLEGEGLQPLLLEAAFGDGDSPLLLPAPSGDGVIALRGRVDRVDGGAGGRVVVVDYKSGAVDGSRYPRHDVGRIDLQLLIYAAWARQRFAATAVDGWYRSLRNGARSAPLGAALDGKRPRDLAPLLELDPARRAERRHFAAVTAAAGAVDLEAGPDNLADLAWAFHEAQRQGRFDVRPYDSGRVCRGCPYTTVCRVDARGEPRG